ncbi:MAG TPA: response regulator [Clostridiaceae bacterium]|nr:response regulator [Clostridiaceae bacterium]
MYKVMLVDDEYWIRKGIAEGINWNALGFEVCATASNGEEALSLMENDIPDVLLTDIKMPVMDGIELIRNVAMKYPSVKTVILSGYNDFAYAQKAIEYGTYAYILKPIKDEEFNLLFSKLFNELEVQKKAYNNLSGQFLNLKNNRLDLEEYYLLKYIAGNFYDTNELKRELAELGSIIPDHYLCCIVFTYDSIDKNEKPINLTNIILYETKRYWNKSNYPVLLNNDQFIIIPHDSIKISNRDLIYSVKQFKFHLENILYDRDFSDVVLSFGIGKSCLNIESLSVIYKEAVLALQRKFYTGKGSITLYNNKDNSEVGILDQCNYTLDEISEELLSVILDGDLYSICPRIKTLFKALVSSSFYEKNKLIIKCIEIYLSISMKLKDKDLPVNLLNTDDIYHQISKCETLEELISYYEKCITDIATQIKELKNESDNNMIIKIKQYIEANYHKKLSLKDLADHFCMNSSYLSTYFKKHTGINLFDYITYVRMENAKRLLKNSDYQITEISENVGFVDYRHFCTVFKKEIGMSPLQYRLKSF